MSAKIKYFLYARKSTDEERRQVTSLDAQTRELRDLAKREGIFIYETIEESKTAKCPGRPLFNQMLDRIQQGEANGLLCWDIDRLYRNPVDEGRVRWPSPRRDAQRYREGRVAKHRRHSLPPAHVARAWH